MHTEKLGELCVALNINSFSSSELEYLEEYCLLMAPIAEGLDFLQKEENIYFGYFLPTLITIKVKLNKLESSGNLKYLGDFAKAMELALIERFRNYFELTPESYDAVVAAISFPTIKMKFLNALKETAPSVSSEVLQEIFLKCTHQFQVPDSEKEIDIRGNVLTSAYFDFGDSNEGN